MTRFWDFCHHIWTWKKKQSKSGGDITALRSVVIRNGLLLLNGKMQILQFHKTELQYIPFPFLRLLISFGRIILAICELLCTEEIAFTKQARLSHLDKQSNCELSATLFMCASISVNLEGSTLDCTVFHITGWRIVINQEIAMTQST